MQGQSIPQRHLLFISPELLIIVVFYAAGICWAEMTGVPDQLLFVCTLILLSLLFIVYKFKLKPSLNISRFLLALLFLLLGLLQNTRLQANPPADPHHIYNLIRNNQTATIEGILQKYPSVLRGSSGPETKLLVKVKVLHQPQDQSSSAWKYTKASGLVLLTLNGSLPGDIYPGDHLLAKANLSRIYTYSTPGSFNYKKHLANQSIFIKGWIQSPHYLIKLNVQGSSSSASNPAAMSYFSERIRHHLAVFLDKTLRQPSKGLYKAILIGDRNDVPTSVLNSFTASGCLHILAISGMHMGLLALVIVAVISWVLKRSVWLLLHVPVLKIALTTASLPLFFYALIAGGNIPVLRALLMAIVFILAILFDKPENLINHILLAAFFILAWRPWSIFTASFQLSFSAVAAIALIYPLVSKLILLEFPAFITTSISRKNRAEYSIFSLFQKIPGLIFKWFLAGFILSTAASLGTFPLLIFHFNRFSLLAPLSNIFVEPLICFWSLILGLVASLCIPLLPILAKIFLIAGSFGLIIAAKFCAFFSTLPFNSIWLSTPSALEILTFYLFLLCVIISLHLLGRKRRYYLALALFFFCFFIVGQRVNPLAKNSPGSASVTFLDVGHGSSILLQLPENKNILIDGGGSQNERFNIGERIIGPFLWKQKISRLDAVVITHPHADHYNGLPFILTRFHPEQLWINGDSGRENDYRILLDLAEQLGIETRIAQTGEILFQEGTTRILCLHSGQEKGDVLPGSQQNEIFTPNDASIVLRLEVNHKSFLFPADISAALGEMLFKRNSELKADVLMAPHHGSPSSINRDFIRTVAPEYIIISAGRSSLFNFSPGSFYEVQQKGVEVLSTSRDGTISFKVENTKNKQISVSSYQIN